MKTRIYRVTSIAGLDGIDCLVRATSQAQALRYVTLRNLQIRVASQEDILEIAQRGYGVPDATATGTEEEAE